jgi:orotate phosphoribosyltransferase
MYDVEIAQALLEIGAVGFTPSAPITFKSGIISPVYVDNRQLIFWPTQWRQVIEGFQAIIASRDIHFDVVAGIATGGIPHSSVLAYNLRVPTIYIRKESKGHGKQNLIEGGSVAGKTVLLVEDMITTGGSSLAGVTALREAGALVKDCLTITNYGFAMSIQAFQVADVRLHSLTDFYTIVQQAVKSEKLDRADIEIIEDWLREPHQWAERHGFDEEDPTEI